MKHLFFAFMLVSFSAKSQKVTDTLLIKMDTTTYKAVLQLIQEAIPANTLTNKIVLGNILTPLQKFTFVQPADKPKPIKP
jgi:hypothetical protein